MSDIGSVTYSHLLLVYEVSELWSLGRTLGRKYKYQDRFASVSSFKNGGMWDYATLDDIEL